MKVLVTGATGSVGSRVVRQLMGRGHTVRGFDVREGTQPGVEWVQGDLGDAAKLAEVLKGVDAVIHLAAVPSHGSMAQTDWWPRLWEINVNGTFQLLWAMHERGVSSLVYASSISILHNNGYQRHTPRTLPYLPLDDAYPWWEEVEEPYVFSKQANELTARMFVHRGLLRGAVALRLANVCNATEAGTKALHTANPAWTKVDGEDAAQAFCLAMEKQLEGHHAFFIGSRYRYRADGERQSPAETRAELAAKGLGAVPEKPGFLEAWQSIATSERAAEVLGYAPRF